MIIKERGWSAHYCLANYCLFRRNTLLKNEKYCIVVSTVGNCLKPKSEKIWKIGIDRYYETMVFHSYEDDNEKYYDADVTRQIYVELPNTIGKENQDYEANEMHENVVIEIQQRMIEGTI